MHRVAAPMLIAQLLQRFGWHAQGSGDLGHRRCPPIRGGRPLVLAAADRDLRQVGNVYEGSAVGHSAASRRELVGANGVAPTVDANDVPSTLIPKAVCLMTRLAVGACWGLHVIFLSVSVSRYDSMIAQLPLLSRGFGGQMA